MQKSTPLVECINPSYNKIIGEVKGIKRQIASKKEKLVDVVEMIKGTAPVKSALKVFNIS